jgi:hypothetical protein
MPWPFYLYPRRYYAMLRHDAMTSMDRLQPGLFFCLCTRKRKLEMGREAMPYVDASGAKLYFEESGHGYPIIFIHEFASDIRGWEAPVATVALPTMPEATHPVMSPKMHLCIAGSSRSTTSLR